MTFGKLLKMLDANGVIYEVVGSQTVRTYTEAHNDNYDVIDFDDDDDERRFDDEED
mgnify:CR=1 FL=1